MIQEKKKNPPIYKGRNRFSMHYCSRHMKIQILDENYFKPRSVTKILLESEDGTMIFIEMHELRKGTAHIL